MNKTISIKIKHLALASMLIIVLAGGYFVYAKSHDARIKNTALDTATGKEITKDPTKLETPTPEKTSLTQTNPPTTEKPKTTKKTAKTVSTSTKPSSQGSLANLIVEQRVYVYMQELAAADYRPRYASMAEFYDMPVKSTKFYARRIDVSAPPVVNSREEELINDISGNKNRGQFLQDEKSKRLKQITIMQNILLDNTLSVGQRADFSDYLKFLENRLAVIEQNILTWPARYKAWQDELTSLQVK